MIHEYTYASHPFDVAGWDGYNFPYAFSIHDFEPITGRVHQPPPVHQTFETNRFVICSFCPRMYDYHPESIPAPYNHSNIDSDDIVISLEGALQISDFVWKGLNQYYYWQEELSDLDDRKALNSSEYAKYINNNPDPEEFFESLKHENDRFSYINSDYVALQNSLQGIVASNGVEF